MRESGRRLDGTQVRAQYPSCQNAATEEGRRCGYADACWWGLFQSRMFRPIKDVTSNAEKLDALSLKQADRQQRDGVGEMVNCIDVQGSRQKPRFGWHDTSLEIRSVRVTVNIWLREGATMSESQYGL